MVGYSLYQCYFGVRNISQREQTRIYTSTLQFNLLELTKKKVAKRNEYTSTVNSPHELLASTGEQQKYTSTIQHEDLMLDNHKVVVNNYTQVKCHRVYYYIPV